MNLSANTLRPRHTLGFVLAGSLIGALTAWGQATPAAAPAATTPETDEETIILSPFEVDGTNDIGYYAENTLAGSRINTNLGDLASSITVVTKQQLVDTGSVDINDVFMYEASTEGTNTYTQTDISRNGIPRDTIAGFSADSGQAFTNATANRVRGLGAADTAQNNYPSISRVPFDAYNTNSLEISRGPNSLLFGTGSPAGIVNQSTATAVIDQRATSIESRFGSFGSTRFSLSHNQPIISDKLAVFFAFLHDEKGYRRKPSDDTTKRYYGAITFKPFAKTKLTFSYEDYDNFNSRPNSQTPRDYVTPWIAAGRPGYNWQTRMITFEDGRAAKGPYVNSTSSVLDPSLPYSTSNRIGTTVPIGNAALTTSTSVLFVPGIQFGIGGSARTVEVTDNGVSQYIIVPAGSAFTTLTAPNTAYNVTAAASRTSAQWVLSDARLSSSNGPAAPVGYGNYVQPSSTDQSIYDWEKINLLQMNYGELQNKTYNFEFQQELLKDLNFSAGWFRQELESSENYTVSNANAITTLFVDTNRLLLDGTPNPYFGSPFLLDISPDTFKNPETNDNYRAMLVYSLDLSKRDGWMRWLGKHNILGLWSYNDDVRATFRYRHSFDGGDLRYQANPTAVNATIANSNNGRMFYVGQNANGVVDHAPGRIGNPGYGGPDTTTARTYNWSTGAWENSPIHYSQNLFYAGTYGTDQKVLNGKSLALQSHFWNDRIVTTFGVRKDDYKARKTNVNGLTTADMYVNGLAIDPDWTASRLTDWFELSGTTRTTGVVFKALKGEHTEFSLLYNQSDNFNPPNGIPVDYFNTPLPRSTGDGKDYGVSLSMFDNKLVARLTWFESTNLNAPSSAGTAIGRVSRQDTSSFRSWATYVVRIMNGQNPTLNNFDNTQVNPLSQTMKDEIAALMQVPAYDNWPPSGISGTQTNNAEGLEFQMIYNPKPNWNIKVTGAQVHSTYQDVAPQIAAWVGDANTEGSRMYVWTHATTPANFPAQYLTFNLFAASGEGTPVSLQNFWTGYGFNADARLSNATGSTPGWVSPKGFWESAVQPEIDVSLALQGKTVPNEREWSFNVISNYSFQEGRLKGFSIGGGLRWADEAVAGFFGDPNRRDSSGNIVAADITNPITTPAETHVDLWASYTTKVFGDRIKVKVQLNVRDALESGDLLPVGYNLDGSAFAYRIVDPRQLYLTTTFSF